MPTEEKILNLNSVEEAIKLLDVYNEVFDCVRLIDAKAVGKGAVIGSVYKTFKGKECAELLGKDSMCDDCVVKRALELGHGVTKIELYCDKLFQATAKPVKINGNYYVIELIKNFDEDLTIDEKNARDRIFGEVDGYYEKIYRDVLTGCYNRRYFEERLRNADFKAGVAVLDVDDFKLYNDVYGHDVGDKVLKTIAFEVKDCMRATDKLVRYGGDEFLVVMPGIKQRVFLDMLFKIRSSVAGIEIDGYPEIKLSVSVGGVMMKDEYISEAVSRADALMYRAKKEKNFIVTDFDEFPAQKQKHNVLIVDDSELNREILSSILKNEFNVIEAGSGEECVKLLKKYGEDLSVVLLDVVMPGMDGFAVLNYMNVSRLSESVPVIMITGDESDASMQRAYDMGVSDYVTRPFDMKVVYRRVMNTIQLYDKQKRLVDRLTRQMIAQENDSRVMTGILSQIVEFRNGECGRHVIMMRRLTELMLKTLVLKTDKYNLSAQDVNHIINASALHDIGKIAIDEKILNKPSKLTKEEYEIIKSHTVIGSEMLRSLKEYANEPLVKFADEICRYHHERWDGKGYPEGLKGDQIPISAQVVSICDVYDALACKRVYKERFSHTKSMRMILEGKCGAFNPLLLECLSELSEEIENIEEQK